MKTLSNTATLILLFLGIAQAFAQPIARNERDEVTPGRRQGKAVIVTGVRFAYPLIQKLIDDYNVVNPDAQVIIEQRGSADPSTYDILVEAYEQDEKIRNEREYVYFAKYAILPVANSTSAFAKIYSDKGLTKDLFNQLFFHDIYADKDKEQKIKAPYTVYTRLQKAGAPIVFTKYFGYEQKDIKGKAIAGADEHLLKALLRDSTGLTYLPLSLIYDHATGKPTPGITVLPVDINGNGRVSDDEKFYANLTDVLKRFEDENPKDIKNIPIEYLHLSMSRQNVNPEAIAFIKWVVTNGQKTLHDYGYLTPEPSRVDVTQLEKLSNSKPN